MKDIALLLAFQALISTSSAIALEVSEPPAPEFKNYAREHSINPTSEGLAKELSDQAKEIADLKDEVAVLKQKVSRLIKVLKLKSENGK